MRKNAGMEVNLKARPGGSHVLFGAPRATSFVSLDPSRRRLGRSRHIVSTLGAAVNLSGSRHYVPRLARWDDIAEEWEALLMA